MMNVINVWGDINFSKTELLINLKKIKQKLSHDFLKKSELFFLMKRAGLLKFPGEKYFSLTGDVFWWLTVARAMLLRVFRLKS